MAVDAVISPLSTLLIEAMLLGTAPMCFMPIEEQGAEHFQLSRNQVHFAELLNHPEIIVGWGGENLLDGVAEIMKRCSNLQYSDRLQQSAEFFIKSHDAPFRERILDFVDQIVGHR
jgi:hypothetical protein